MHDAISGGKRKILALAEMLTQNNAARVASNHDQWAYRCLGSLVAHEEGLHGRMDGG